MQTAQEAPVTESSIAVEIVDGVRIYGRGPSEVRALDGVSARFEAGRFTAIMGPSGSGKSTLMHCLAGLDRLTSGVVRLDGVDLSTLSDRKLTLLRRRRVGFVFQAFNLVSTLTAEENIRLPLDLEGRKPDEAWLRELVDALGLGERLSHRPDELSGGQQQRVAIARALLSRPRVVFADEPTGNLDTRAGAEILQILREAVDRWGQTVLMVTHDPVAASHADRVIFLRDGKLVDELVRPDAASILDRMKRLDGREA
ncbi:MAG: ABC transporter ATP-binding protein [Acidimicrobiales bacterium]|nr:MAG: ABC transporter ATP-binding protein [Acidimicrobiales bacterium]